MGVQNGFGGTRGPRRPQDQRGSRIVLAVAPGEFDAVAPDDDGRAGDLEDVGGLALCRPRVEWYEHGAGEPYGGHRDHQLGPVGQTDGHGLAGPDPEAAQLVGDSSCPGAGGAGGDRLLDGVQQRLVIGEWVVDQQGRERIRR